MNFRPFNSDHYSRLYWVLKNQQYLPESTGPNIYAQCIRFPVGLSCVSLSQCWEENLQVIDAPEGPGVYFKKELLTCDSAAHIGLTYPCYLFILKWIATCGLKKLKLELSKCLGPSCRCQKLAHRAVSAKHCSVIPSVEINVSHVWCSSPSSSLPFVSC